MSKNAALSFRRFFLLTTITTAVSMGAWFGFLEFLVGRPLYGLIAATAFGIFIGLFMTFSHILIDHFSIKWMKAAQFQKVQEIGVGLSCTEAFAALYDCLNDLNNCEITQQNKELGVIHAYMKTTWKSVGKKIAVSISPAQPGNCIVTIVGQPTILSILVDDRSTVEIVYSIMNKMLQRAPILKQ